MSVVDSQAVVDSIPAVRDLGLQLQLTEDGAVFTAALGEGHSRYQGTAAAHGGAVAAILDTAGAVATYLHDQQSWVTLNMNLTYLRPTPLGAVEGEATFVHRGRSLTVVRVVLRAAGRACAEATLLMTVAAAPTAE